MYILPSNNEFMWLSGNLNSDTTEFILAWEQNEHTKLC